MGHRTGPAVSVNVYRLLKINRTCSSSGIVGHPQTGITGQALGLIMMMGLLLIMTTLRKSDRTLESRTGWIQYYLTVVSQDFSCGRGRGEIER